MRTRAFLMIRHEPQYRRASFAAGLEACGYEIHGSPRDAIRPDDVLIIWNRYGAFHGHANRFEAAGARVIVAENGPLGREWNGSTWYSLVLGHPAGAGSWPAGSPERWNSFGAEICEWRKGCRETIVLAQRGIGPPGVAQPPGWHQKIARALEAFGPVRIREHPGEKVPATSLEQDLAHACCAVTWASGAGLKALLWGIPVFHGLPTWYGAPASHPLSIPLPAIIPALRPRLPMFQRLGWTMWRTPEIAQGAPFRFLLGL